MTTKAERFAGGTVSVFTWFGKLFGRLLNSKNRYRLLGLLVAALLVWQVWEHLPTQEQYDAWLVELVLWGMKLVGLTAIGIINAAILDFVIWTLFDSVTIVRECMTVLRQWYEKRWQATQGTVIHENRMFDAVALLTMGIVTALRRIQFAIILSATYLIAFIG